MTRINVIVGMEPEWEDDIKHKICESNGVKTKRTNVYKNLDKQRDSRKKEILDEIFGEMKFEDAEPITIFTNSDTVLQWINNAVLLGEVNDEKLEEKIGMVSIKKEWISSYEYDPEKKMMKKNEFGEYGFVYEKLNEGLVDLFEASILIQEKLESKEK